MNNSTDKIGHRLHDGLHRKNHLMTHEYLVGKIGKEIYESLDGKLSDDLNFRLFVRIGLSIRTGLRRRISHVH